MELDSLNSKVCRNWSQKGFCKFGSRCIFASTHTPENKPPSSVYNPQKSQQVTCKHWEQSGFCPFGGRCFFASSHRRVANVWKAGVCSEWEETGQCRYGTRCHYASSHRVDPEWLKKLSIMPHRDEIIQVIRNHQVVIIGGETGYVWVEFLYVKKPR